MYEGTLFEETVQRINIAGRDLTYHMQALLKREGIDVDLESARKIKEAHC